MSERRFVELCYSAEQDITAWMNELARFRPLVSPASIGCSVYPFSISADGLLEVPHIALDPRGLEHVRDDVSPSAFIEYLQAAADSRAVVHEIFGDSTPNVKVPATMSQRVARALAHALQPGWDTIGLLATLDGREGIALATLESQRVSPLSARQHARLGRLCEHLAVGYRLRRYPRAPGAEHGVAAVFRPDGRLVHAEPEAQAIPLRGSLIEAVRAMDSARCVCKRRTPAEALDLWQALIAGEYALVEQFDSDGRRCILALRVRSTPAALSARELAVIASAADGLSNKVIGAKLGISAATVAVHLTAAKRKLGVPNRLAIVLWYRSLLARASS